MGWHWLWFAVVVLSESSCGAVKLLKPKEALLKAFQLSYL